MTTTLRLITCSSPLKTPTTCLPTATTFSPHSAPIQVPAPGTCPCLLGDFRQLSLQLARTLWTPFKYLKCTEIPAGPQLPQWCTSHGTTMSIGWKRLTIVISESPPSLPDYIWQKKKRKQNLSKSHTVENSLSISWCTVFYHLTVLIYYFSEVISSRIH